MKGEIADMDQALLYIRQGGRVHSVKRSEIVYIEVEYLEAHRRGLEALAAGKLLEAVDHLEDAVRLEHRPWLRRRAYGSLLRAYEENHAFDLALQRLAEIANDKNSFPDWPDLPVWWYASSPPEKSLDPARRLANSPRPEAAIVAASYLIAATGKDEQLGVGILRQYAADVDLTRRTVARCLLALHDHGTLNPEHIRHDLNRLPIGLQAGGFLCLAQLLERKGDRLDAALAYIRAGTLHGGRRGLAARALHRAAQLLDQAGFEREATTLYRELASRYADTPEGTAAAARFRRR